MASLTIRNIEESLKGGLRKRAASHGRSMEEEVRQILKRTLLHDKAATGLGSRVAARFAAAGGVELPELRRSRPRPAPDFAPRRAR